MYICHTELQCLSFAFVDPDPLIKFNLRRIYGFFILTTQNYIYYFYYWSILLFTDYVIPIDLYACIRVVSLTMRALTSLAHSYASFDSFSPDVSIYRLMECYI